MRILLLVAALAAASQAQDVCSLGACYPPSGDLLLGRSQGLQASSTCGLMGSEVFCTPYQQRRMKCCPCDSRNPDSQLAHTVQDVLSTAGPDRWWQSRKGVSPVTLQLDLGNLFQLDNLVLSFKGPRPSALVIERTDDGGRTWRPAVYMATDCHRAFPGVSTTTPLTLDQTYCYTLPPTGGNPYQDHTIQFSPLHQYMYVPVPKSQKIEDVSPVTGLRVRLTELGDVPRLPGRALSQFYALKEMRVMGRCMCHGHAHRCLPETHNNLPSNGVQVNAQCDCQHNTAGVNCERCADLYNDLPWRPAEEDHTHACKRCECHNHAQRCRFDAAVFEASGWTSGGVCEDCAHHTTGPKCERCAPGYQPNPRSRMDRPDACIRCVCNADGTVNGDRCEDVTGSCRCKANVDGPRCERCRSGFYGLSGADPLGCSKCSCSPDGSLSDVCDPVTGQCPCRTHFHGRTCDACAKGFWKPIGSTRCEACGCDATNSLSDACDQSSGQCQCRPGFGGRTCAGCADGAFGDPLIGCQLCRCNPDGTVPEVCDKLTGACLCRPGVTGTRCDSCGRERCRSFPDCPSCPSCFFTLDAQMHNLTSVLNRLSGGLPARPGGSGDPGQFGPRIHALESSLNRIRNSIHLPLDAASQIDDALSELDRLRDQINDVNDNLPPLERSPGLDSALDRLQGLLDRLNVEYKAKNDALRNSISPINTEPFNTIKKAYNESTDAANKVDATKDTVRESADVREDALNLRNRVQLPNIRHLNNLNRSMASGPDLTPVAKQVCGSLRSEPCTPLQCDGGDLCPPEGAPPCQKGKKCVGALPLSKRATADAQGVKERLDRLTQKITEAAEMLQDTQEKTNQVRDATGKLNNRVKKARDELDEDLDDIRKVVGDLKDFLSDPSSNLSHIQDVSDWILNAKLPLSLSTLKKKVKQLEDLAAGLPDSTAVLKEAEPQLEAARKLLQEAQDARETAEAVKTNVDKMEADFRPLEESLSDMEDKLQDSMDLIDDLNNKLTQVRDQLNPAEEALDDVSELMKPMKPQLDELRDLLERGDGLTEDALDNAGLAEDEAAAADKDLKALEKELQRLKDEAGPGEGAGPGEAGQIADRVAKLHQDAGALANMTESMLKALEGKADSLKSLQDQVLLKSARLQGLDTKLRDLLQKLRSKASELQACQG